ncbi:hypothetical protein DINM_000181 [Dirofilaria immitis]|nr:hypothetical protein [Dirofilaria immitis]
MTKTLSEEAIRTTKEEEEKVYECVIESEDGLSRIMYKEKEALITLTRYEDDAEQKLEQYNPGETLALLVVSSNSKLSLPAVQSDQHSSRFTITKRRLCIFDTQNHWDSECDVYATANGRRNRLKSLKKCPISFKDNHNGERCKIKNDVFIARLYTIVRCVTTEIQFHQTAFAFATLRLNEFYQINISL